MFRFASISPVFGVTRVFLARSVHQKRSTVSSGSSLLISHSLSPFSRSSQRRSFKSASHNIRIKIADVKNKYAAKSRKIWPFHRQNLNEKETRKKHLFFGGLFLLGCGYVISQIEQVPISGRYRVNLTPKVVSDIVIYLTNEELLYQAEVDAYSPRSTEARRVQRVLNRLIQANNLPDFPVFVMPDPTLNAFCSIGGIIVVNTGMLAAVENDDQLATILAHEISHYIAKHSEETIVQSLFLKVFSFVLDQTGMLGLIMDFFHELPGSRKREREADYMGLMIMAHACFDISQASEVWKMMELHTPQATNSYTHLLSTHPTNAERMENLSPNSPSYERAQAIYNSSRCSEKKPEIGFTSAFRKLFVS